MIRTTRSPLRSTAITELAAGVVGDAEPWRIETGHSLSPLQATLQRMPSTVQERWFARLFMIKPMVIGVLALFWIVTGLITLFEPGAAVRVLTHRGWGDEAALSIVVVGAMVDLGLGLACLRRAWTSWAAGGMIAVSMVYLVVATLVAPDLWRDPLGPLVKVVPAMMLALAALAMAEER